MRANVEQVLQMTLTKFSECDQKQQETRAKLDNEKSNCRYPLKVKCMSVVRLEQCLALSDVFLLGWGSFTEAHGLD